MVQPQEPPGTGEPVTPPPARRRRRLRPGIHTLTAGVYHADPCSKPSLSASIAKVLCDESPAHAWQRHPRLNPAYQREETSTFDVGSAAHAMLLEDNDPCVGVAAKDWRTKDAREQRDAIRQMGRIPLLMDQYERVIELAAHARTALRELDMWPTPLTGGKPEQTIIWREGTGRDAVVCRGLIDWLRDDLVVFDDLKTTTRGANPLRWAERRIWELGLDVQGAFYQRGLKAITGETVEPRFVVIDRTCRCCSASPAAPAPARRMERDEAREGPRRRQAVRGHRHRERPRPKHYADDFAVRRADLTPRSGPSATPKRSRPPTSRLPGDRRRLHEPRVGRRRRHARLAGGGAQRIGR
jgi:hypothetical protein